MLDVRGIHVGYGAVRALRGVTLSVGPGEMVSLLGANGAGKTTTLRAISGMIAPQQGEILFDGRPIHEMPAHEVVRLGIAHMPEGRELFPTLTVEENLRFGYLPRRKEPGYAEDLERSYTLFPRLQERRRQAAGTMSGGEQQMLAMARALMSRPRLLLIDELSLGLAPIIVDLLFETLDGVNRSGTAALIVEQFVHMALGHTRRAYVLAKGTVALEGASRELRDHPQLLASYLGEAETSGAAEERPSGKPSAHKAGASKARASR
ncbi:MAG: ABC transporter ATP-binding protein [Acidobacteria bacterium]|nr:ABC transporter ATP-binding protein [Acidobacteriota bacterium]